MNKGNKINDYLKTVWWSFMDDGWQEDSNYGMKASYYEIEAMEEVLKYFKQKKYEKNFVIQCIKEVKEVDYLIELEDNEDSFGHVIEQYYAGDSRILNWISDNDEEYNKKFQKDFDKLKTNYNE